ncbi:MAG TPA: hypothetical protein VL147_13065 [Devosia sp.]|nr:hypothetical protein [Devosia sp.]
MAPRFSFKAGRIVVADDARTVLDTVAKSFIENVLMGVETTPEAAPSGPMPPARNA